MEQLHFTNASNVASANLNFKTNNRPKTKIDEIQPRENIGVSQDAANSLKAQVLYKKSDNKTEYLSNELDKKQIIEELKNKEKMGRSFFGYKTNLANIITKADDIELATANFNYLLNAKDGKLNARDITDILRVATSINNGKMSERLQNKYGFNGGNLKEENIDSILDRIKKQSAMEEYVMMQQQTMAN